MSLAERYGITPNFAMSTSKRTMRIKVQGATHLRILAESSTALVAAIKVSLNETTGYINHPDSSAYAPATGDQELIYVGGFAWVEIRWTSGSGTISALPIFAGGGDSGGSSGLLTEAEFERRIADPSTAWTKNHRPGNNTKATVTKTTPGAGFRLVITKLVWRIQNGTTAPTATALNATLVDDAGAPVTYWSEDMNVNDIANDRQGTSENVWIPLAENVAAVFAFSAAGGNNSKEMVYMEGFVEAV